MAKDTAAPTEPTTPEAPAERPTHIILHPGDFSRLESILQEANSITENAQAFDQSNNSKPSSYPVIQYNGQVIVKAEA